MFSIFHPFKQKFWDLKLSLSLPLSPGIPQFEGTTCSGNLFLISCNLQQDFPNETWLPLGETLTTSRPLPERMIWRLFGHSSVIPFTLELFHCQKCINHRRVWPGITGSIVKRLSYTQAGSVFFGLLTWQHMTVSLTAEIHDLGTACSFIQSSCLSLNWLNTLILSAAASDRIQIPPLLSRQANLLFIIWLDPLM